MPLFIPLVAAADLSTQWQAILSGLLMFAIPPLFTLSTVAYLGKPGFNYMRGLVFGFIKKHGPPQVVGRARYYIGLAMFVAPLLYGLLEPYADHLIPGHDVYRLAYSKAGDLLIVISLFVLGGDFWDKLKSLFVYGARAQFPAPRAGAGSGN